MYGYKTGNKGRMLRYQGLKTRPSVALIHQKEKVDKPDEISGTITETILDNNEDIEAVSSEQFREGQPI